MPRTAPKIQIPYELRKEYHRQYHLKHHAKRLARNRIRNARLKEEASALASAAKSRPCVDCGIQYPPWVMQFDHVRGTKLFDISTAVNRLRCSLSTLMAEIEKCDVVCANCHADRTHKRRRALRGSNPRPPSSTG